MGRKISVTESKIIGTSYMYPNESLIQNTMYLNQPITIKPKIMEFVCSVSEIQTEYSSLDNMSLYRYRLHKIDSWDVPK